LVARYPDKATHDIERNAALLMVDEVTATAEKRIGELKQQRKTFDQEMEFYKKDPNKAPMSLRRKIGENEDSIAELQRFVLSQDQEKRKVHQRFDAELAKLKVLWETYKPVGTPGASDAKPAASAASR
jgi:DNA-binding transcriptional regulator GbsR (MarR family)